MQELTKAADEFCSGLATETRTRTYVQALIDNDAAIFDGIELIGKTSDGESVSLGSLAQSQDWLALGSYLIGHPLPTDW